MKTLKLFLIGALILFCSSQLLGQSTQYFKAHYMESFYKTADQVNSVASKSVDINISSNMEVTQIGHEKFLFRQMLDADEDNSIKFLTHAEYVSTLNEGNHDCTITISRGEKQNYTIRFEYHKVLIKYYCKKI
jgi:hypothetical protein